jgi:hypothetical protein
MLASRSGRKLTPAEQDYTLATVPWGQPQQELVCWVLPCTDCLVVLVWPHCFDNTAALRVFASLLDWTS